MNLLRFKIGGSFFSIRADIVIRIIGEVDILENQWGKQDTPVKNENEQIKIYNLGKLFDLQNRKNCSSRIIILNSYYTPHNLIIDNPYGILADEIINIGDGIVNDLQTTVPLLKGVDPKIIEGFELIGEEISIILNCNLIRELYNCFGV